jgi:hypothetical protein
MKKVLLASAFLFLSSTFVLAQSSPSSPSSTDQQQPSTTSPSSTDQQQPSNPSPSMPQSDQSASQTSSMGAGNEQKIEGCLSQGANGFTLADASGTTYNLTGDTSKLSSHVGEQVEVHGTPSSSPSSAASSQTAGGASAQNFDVKSVKRIAKSCSTSGTSSQPPK